VNTTPANNPAGSAVQSWQVAVWEWLRQQHARGSLAHAYLAYGEQGIGKFDLLRHFARYLLCKSPVTGSLCGTCVNCALAEGGAHPDVLIVAPEEGSRDIKIDQIRSLAEFVARTSHSGLMKVIVINQAHQLNVAAANSLLKTLEEPASKTVLFLVTERPGSLPATLRSRCQRLQFATPAIGVTADWLTAKGLTASDALTLATAAGSRPLYALALAERDGVNGAQDFLRQLSRLLQSQSLLQHCVAVALKLGEAVAVEYLLRASTIVIRSLSQEEEPGDQVLAEVLHNLRAAAVSKEELLRKLLAFNALAEQAQREVQGSTNPNPQLLLESLLWQWSKLGPVRHSSRARG
jgi:DNA polymerase-3 subunit delta'